LRDTKTTQNTEKPNRRDRRIALDARSGELLWRVNLGGQIASGPISYAINGRQYVAISAGNSLVAYALKE
jgi:alcohol dehydrogenase (cytochrome c)